MVWCVCKNNKFKGPNSLQLSIFLPKTKAMLSDFFARSFSSFYFVVLFVLISPLTFQSIANCQLCTHTFYEILNIGDGSFNWIYWLRWFLLKNTDSAAVK